jgi:hypothetical protein
LSQNLCSSGVRKPTQSRLHGHRRIRVRGAAMCALLRGEDGAAQSGAGAVFPLVADRIFRGHRQRTGDCVAGGRFAGAAEFSGGGAERDAAGSLDDIADAAVDRCGNASSGVRLGTGVVRGERGDALHRTAGDGGGLSGVSDAAGEGLGDRHADAGAVGQAGSQACAEGIERGLDESA